MQNVLRDRRVVLACAFAAMAIGLASRRYGSALPAFLAEYAGDTLWAVMLFWLLALFFRGASGLMLATATVAVSFAVEISQLWHAPWLDAVRANRFGALVLGSGFLWSDLVCYVAGACIAFILDRILFHP